MLAPSEVIARPITARLCVQGWSHLDAVILAALALQSPALLIGRHGTAKTWVVEQLAQALRLDFRHYNASLVNYDDLVGIPMPEAGHNRLQFVTTEDAIWDAEFVFFDEVSRCRPDLQNKLFPIINERRVVGRSLKRLQHRWAAMNPPASDSAEADAAANAHYLGSEPLDPALIDRFAFVIPVPDWQDLSREDQRRIILYPAAAPTAAAEAVAALDLPLLVQQCRDLVPEVEAELGAWVGDYLVCLMDLLAKAKLPQSPRRARMLARNLAAVHAARCILEGETDDVETSAELALLFGLPQSATEAPPSAATLVAVHKQAWEIATRLDDAAWRQLLEEPDAIQRVLLADELGFADDDIARLVTQALATITSPARKMSLACAMFLFFRERRLLTPAAWEPLVKLALPVLQPRLVEYNAAPNSPDGNLWNEIKPFVLKRRGEGDRAQLEVNYVLAGYPDLWRQRKWQEALAEFIDDLQVFNIQERAQS